MNLLEAFKQLDSLNEETFSVDADGIKKLSAFTQSDDSGDELDVFDLDAMDDEEAIDACHLNDIILDCCVCHSKIFAPADKLVVDEETGVANAGEECPYCYSVDGYKVIGQVAPIEDAEVKADSEQFNELKKTVDAIKDSDSEDSLIQSTENMIRTKLDFAERVKDDDDDVNESLKESKELSTVEGTLGNVLDAHMNELSRLTTAKEIGEFLETIKPEIKKDQQAFVDTVIEKVKRLPDMKALQYVYNIILKGDNLSTKMDDKKRLTASVEDDYYVGDEDGGRIYHGCEAAKKAAKKLADSGVKVIMHKVENELKESQEEIKTNESLEASEVIEPVSDEVKDQIELDVDEFDDESFDKLTESFLKQNYSNIDSYKTKNVTSKGNKFFVEGIIKFESGKERKTSFLFEAVKASRNNKIRLIGENINFAKDHKSLSLVGSVDSKKLISESLAYNYKQKDESGKIKTIRGSVKSK